MPVNNSHKMIITISNISQSNDFYHIHSNIQDYKIDAIHAKIMIHISLNINYLSSKSIINFLITYLFVIMVISSYLRLYSEISIESNTSIYLSNIIYTYYRIQLCILIRFHKDLFNFLTD